jgi:L-arabinose isomerase
MSEEDRMIDLANLEAWFVAGSQHLYGPKALKHVAGHSAAIASALSASTHVPVKVVAKPVMMSGESIHQLCLDASASKNCVGLITWMHTFSPARMWSAGLRVLHKPFLHLHTQFNENLPWSSIDMDFMNLNQSAHGDREFGYIGTRMGRERKIVVGFWQDAAVHAEIGVWARTAYAWHDAQRLRVARFGDNMRKVAVTEGDKVDARSSCAIR